MNEYRITYLSHHGILKQRWGIRNGPPYPLGGGDYSQAERKAIYKERRNKNSIYNKRHFDKTLKSGHKIQTLSYNKDRTKDSDMFYGTYNRFDNQQYNALFNKPIPQTVYDNNGNAIGSGLFLKYRIINTAKKDIKIASEDSGAEVFRQLFKKDRDFYNFVTDEERMQSRFVDDKYRFRGYRESKSALEKLRLGKDITSDDLQIIYRMFNYTIPSDGEGNRRWGDDVTKQRTKFFNALKEAGYGAVLDTNDAIYGGFKSRSPIIVFDMDSVVLSDAERVKLSDKKFAELEWAGRKMLGL